MSVLALNGEVSGVFVSTFPGLNIPAMSPRIVFESSQRDSNLPNGLVGVTLCLARLRSAIPLASSLDKRGPNLIGVRGG